MHSLYRFIMAAIIAISFSTIAGFAGDRATKPEAVAMAKKAIDFVKANGAQKAYEEFTSKSAAFHDRDLYVVVYDLTGKCLAHGTNAKLVGKDLSESQDADGVYYNKKRLELAKTSASFWLDYKYADPLTKKLEPKSAYCEKLSDTLICSGIYK